MPFPRKATADELAGVQCAADSYNTAKAEAMAADGVDETKSAPLSPEEYWDWVLSQARVRDDKRDDVEIFDDAVLSYQSHFDVGLGAAGVKDILAAEAKAESDQVAVAGAIALKLAYETEARAKAAIK